ncbi:MULTISPECIES: hypothetical protein [Arthrobacter]|uniref:Uncharacterized protein n=1 Tax=Arthrobacter terricola TaxID=2547396 RepID=A0A4R5KPH3_9MICC|nr:MULTISPECIES: hypothetical protein [Arthrobacter]MBT8161011.1 hypothetical protein [Arthrobacter sp. GN70]TDF96875.1 hypothetical protein E1809_09130 [Arthrobacter terricola]
MNTVIRAIPTSLMHINQFGERYFTTDKLSWQQQIDLKDELAGQGYLVQEIYLPDPLQVLVERRVRTELQAESAKKPL